MDHEAEVKGVGASVEHGGYGAPVVVLQARDEFVPIFVSPDQAHSMRFALDGEPSERPLTHDLLIEMLTDFGGAIDKVRIDDLQDGTFYAKIDAERYEDGERERFVFDARPSDGIALGIRIDCPIVISDEVIDEAGLPPDEFEVREGSEEPTGDADAFEFGDREDPEE